MENYTDSSISYAISVTNAQIEAMRNNSVMVDIGKSHLARIFAAKKSGNIARIMQACESAVAFAWIGVEP